jgi:hypothetical protein
MSGIIADCKNEDAVNGDSSDSVYVREARRKLYGSVAVISDVSAREGTDNGDMRHDECYKLHDGIAAARIKEQRDVQTDADGKRYVSLGDGNCRHVHVIQADEHDGEFHQRLKEAFSPLCHDLSVE